MTRQTATQTQQQASTTSLLSRGGILQRKCESCGQHTIAGGECMECGKQKSGLQRKLTIGSSNDPLEREADRIADQVIAAPAHPAVSGSPPRIQRFTGQMTEGMGTAPASVDRVLSSPGRPLEPGLQQDMGQRFGHDFSQVRVHTDMAAGRSARDVNANAYTVGNNVVFGAGKYAPNTREGKRLLAHELTHVVQQTNNNDFLQRGIDQLELEKCMASLGDNTKQRKGVIVDLDAGTATKEDLERYEKECTERQLERQRQKQSKLDDLLEAVGLSIELIPGAVKRHAGEMAEGLLEGLIDFAKDAAKILAASTTIGALIGAIVGAGAGAIPGAEIGFEIGLEILEVYGLAMLIQTIIDMAAGFISNLGQFLDIVFHANGDKDQLKKAANNLAEAVGILVSALLMALLAYLLKEGTERISKTKFAKTVGESRLAKWFKERSNKETSKKFNQSEPAKKIENQPKPKEDSQTKKTDQPSEHVKIEEPSLDDTRKVQVTEEGKCGVCASPCEDIRKRYSEELAKNPKIGKRISDVEKSSSSLADKEAQYKAIDQELADIRLESFSNGTKLKSEGWIGKKVNVDGPLPEGYNWNNGKVHRKAGNVDANYAPLEVSEKGKLKVSESKRLSNPSTMKTNFKNALTAEVKAKNPKWGEDKVKSEVERQLQDKQIHHLLPDEVIKNHPLGKAAREGRYDLDKASNLKGLADSKNLKNIEPGHWSSHPEYTKQVEVEMTKSQKNLEDKHKTSIDKVPKVDVLKEMERLERLFRDKIERGDVPMKDGRLTEITPKARTTQDEESYA